MGAPSQRFNHVALSVSPDLLDEAGRGDLLRFYGDVFGWTEMPTLTVPRERLVLRAHSNEQFVFLVAGEPALRSGAGDHFGLSVATPAEFDDLYARAREESKRDDRVELDEKQVEDHHGVLSLHNFYVRFLLPLRVEVQCYEWAAGLGPDSTAEDAPER
ncbi:MAG: hypothetical protein ACQGVC_21005 [Myxococcota bacterium]